MTLFRTTILPLLLIASPVIAGAPARWTVDPARSTLGFSGTQTGSPFHGRFGRYTAVISFDPDHPETAHIAADIDARSASTGDTQRDEALPGKDWFDSARFPVARFVTTRVERKGPNAYLATGTLTLHGVTRPVLLPFTLTVNGNEAHAKGHAQLLRNAFGVGQGAWSSGQWVALAVGVDVDIVAKRAN